MRWLKIGLVMTAVLLAFAAGLGNRRVRAFSAGPPASHTNAPGETNCTACHSSFQLNSGLGSVFLGGLPTHFTPNQRIDFTITTEHPDGFLYGFQLTAVDAAGNEIGTLSHSDAGFVQSVNGIVGMTPRVYLEHTFAGAFPVEFDRRVWAVSWTPPSTSTGPVTFYFSGNGANGDGETTGDYIYTGQKTLGCSAASPSSVSISAIGGNGALTIGSSCAWTAVSQSTWVTITSQPNGNGDGNVTYTVAPNPTQSPRSGSILIDGISVPILQGANFLDVPLDSTFYTHIGKLSARGVTLGCGEGNYCPSEAVTRAQIAAFIMRALGTTTPTPPVIPTFADVTSDHPFYALIEDFARRGITQGCGSDIMGNRLFCPNSTVTREQMAALMIRAVGVFNPPVPTMQRFADVFPTHPFYAFIEEMAVREITLGCGPGVFCPQALVTREQMAAFLVRAFHL